MSINNRRSPSRRMNEKPKRGTSSICQPSAAKRSIAAVIAPYRSVAGSRRWDSITLPLQAEHSHPARRSVALVDFMAVSTHAADCREQIPRRLFSSSVVRTLYRMGSTKGALGS